MRMVRARGTRFLDLQKGGVVFTCNEEGDSTKGPDTADADNFDGQVTKVEAIKQHPNTFGQRIALHRDGFGITRLSRTAFSWARQQNWLESHLTPSRNGDTKASSGSNRLRVSLETTPFNTATGAIWLRGAVTHDGDPFRVLIGTQMRRRSRFFAL